MAIFSNPLFATYSVYARNASSSTMSSRVTLVSHAASASKINHRIRLPQTHHLYLGSTVFDWRRGQTHRQTSHTRSDDCQPAGCPASHLSATLPRLHPCYQQQQPQLNAFVISRPPSVGNVF